MSQKLYCVILPSFVILVNFIQNRSTYKEFEFDFLNNKLKNHLPVAEAMISSKVRQIKGKYLIQLLRL